MNEEFKQITKFTYPEKMKTFLKTLDLYRVVTLIINVIAVYAIIFLASMLAKEQIMVFDGSENLQEMKRVHDLETTAKQGIRHYLQSRFNWTPENVKEAIKKSSFFIDPSSKQSFSGALKNVEKFSVEKRVSQRIYPTEIAINWDKNSAYIKGDRISEIQGMKAAGELKLELLFDFGMATKENPWGIYIVQEREE
jgi:hypothetical protein